MARIVRRRRGSRRRRRCARSVARPRRLRRRRRRRRRAPRAAEADDATAVDCADYEAFGDLEGTRVTVYTSIVAPEDAAYINSYAPFEECTGVDVQYEGSKEFEAQLPVRIQAGNPPDIAFIPQPGLLQTLVREFDAIVPVGEAAEANVDEYYDPAWKEYGSVDGVFYAPPNSSNVKSFVWYSPAAFEENGYEIPTTWDDLIALTEQITEDHAEGATKAWCAGIGSGDATGWPATDWMEDIILRNNGPEVYDQWWKHEIPFNDPQIVDALDQAGEILKNPDFVNGGLGDVSTIATTTFQDGGLPILDGSCFLHRQASFYAANFQDAGAGTRRRGRRRLRLLPAWAERGREAGARRWRVHRCLPLGSRGGGLPGLPHLARVGEPAGAGGLRVPVRQQGPGPGERRQRDLQAVRGDSPGSQLGPAVRRLRPHARRRRRR